MNSLNDKLNGEYEGIGIQIVKEEENVFCDTNSEIVNSFDSTTEINLFEKKDRSNEKIIIAALLTLVGVIVVIAICFISINKSAKKDEKNSNRVESNTLSSSNNNGGYNPTIKIVATFDGNGATVSQKEVTCYADNLKDGCMIDVPEISKEGAIIIGYSTDKESKVADIKPNTQINITEDVKYYAITRSTITATFEFPNTKTFFIIFLSIILI